MLMLSLEQLKTSSPTSAGGLVLPRVAEEMVAGGTVTVHFSTAHESFVYEIRFGNTPTIEAIRAERRPRPPSVEQFHELAERWRQESSFMSSAREMASHPAYKAIISMGREVVPLILRELQQRPDHWFWALATITGEDPVPPESHGNVREMAGAWLLWGRERGYLP